MRLPPPIIAAIAIGLIYLSRQILQFTPSEAISGAVRPLLQAVMFLCIGLGLMLDLESVARFFRNKTTINPIKPSNSQKLVTSGFYRFTRNPMYLGMVFFLIAATIYWRAPLGVIIIFGFMAFMGATQIKAEEDALSDIFGQEFETYKSRVRRWL